MREGGFTAYSGLSARIPPDHTRIRRAGAALLRTEALSIHRKPDPRHRERALDAMEPKGEADFHAEFAYDVPALVLFRLVGVPTEDVAKVKAWGGQPGAV